MKKGRFRKSLLLALALVVFLIVMIIVTAYVTRNKASRIEYASAPMFNTRVYADAKILAVSGYWDIGKDSRYSNTDEYYRNFHKTTNFNTDYLIYGEQYITSLIKRFRENKLTYERVLTWTELITLCEEEFNSHNILQIITETSLHRDTDGEIHCPSNKLLLIWIAKVLLVREAVKLYPQYTHYGWIDAGYKGNIENISRPWPTNDLTYINGLYVRRLSHACRPWNENGLEKCPIAGMWFGDKTAIIEFTNICVGIIKQKLSQGSSVCTEQDIFELALREMNYSDIVDVKRSVKGGSGYEAIFL